MHERKALMAKLAGGFVALPGGCGTLEELFEVFTWAQLGMHDKPCGLLNVRGYYDPLLRAFDRMVSEGFYPRNAVEPWLVASTPEDLLVAFDQHTPRHRPQVDRPLGDLAQALFARPIRVRSSGQPPGKPKADR